MLYNQSFSRHLCIDMLMHRSELIVICSQELQCTPSGSSMTLGEFRVAPTALLKVDTLPAQQLIGPPVVLEPPISSAWIPAPDPFGRRLYRADVRNSAAAAAGMGANTDSPAVAAKEVAGMVPTSGMSAVLPLARSKRTLSHLLDGTAAAPPIALARSASPAAAAGIINSSNISPHSAGSAVDGDTAMVRAWARTQASTEGLAVPLPLPPAAATTAGEGATAAAAATQVSVHCFSHFPFQKLLTHVISRNHISGLWRPQGAH